jgi:outer membrane protein assembly factor BamB
MDGVVYVGSFDGNVYALNTSTGTVPLDEFSSDVIWKFKTNDMVMLSSAISEGMFMWARTMETFTP